MIPWQRVDAAPLPAAPSPRGVAPAAAELSLWRRGEELAIRIGGTELMNSRQHHSEDELGRLACAHLSRGHVARVLIGGLGMGFTLRAVLDALGPKALVEVAELVPAVVTWNRGVLGALANHPLADPRTKLYQGDVGVRLQQGGWDAILLDVDNGPAALTAAENQGLYDAQGLRIIYQALRPGGVLAVWSATDDARFSKRLRGAGFDVLRHHVRARPNAGAIHVLSIATKGPAAEPQPSGPRKGAPRDAGRGGAAPPARAKPRPAPTAGPSRTRR